MHYFINRNLDYQNALLVDSALELEMNSNCSVDDQEEIAQLVFFRAFHFSNASPVQVEEWVENLFFHAPSYIWLNGKMVGGLCYPQEDESEVEGDYLILKESLSELVLYVPKNKNT